MGASIKNHEENTRPPARRLKLGHAALLTPHLPGRGYKFFFSTKGEEGRGEEATGKEEKK